MAMEYITHLIPLVPGPGEATAGLLNRFAAEGWRLASSFPMPVQRGSALLPEGPQHGLGLFVVLEREVGGGK